MVVGFVQLLAFNVDMWILALLAFLVARTRDAIAGTLLLSMALMVAVGADYMMLFFDGERASSPGVLWHFFQLFVVVTVGGMACLSGGVRGATVVCYGACAAMMFGMLLMSILAKDVLPVARALSCFGCLLASSLILFHHVDARLITELASGPNDRNASRTGEAITEVDGESSGRRPNDRAGRAAASTGGRDDRTRCESLRRVLRFGIFWNAAISGLAVAPWAIIVVNHDVRGFMGHAAAGPGAGAFLTLLSLCANPGAVGAGPLIAYVLARSV